MVAEDQERSLPGFLPETLPGALEMKVLILGARGMLGKDLVPILSTENEVLGRDIDDFDISDQKRVQKEIETFHLEVVINAAAYTDVDGCESRRELAFSVNAESARNVALACAETRARMIHLSTDYVFNGHSQTPYCEEDPPNPLNVYGASKLQGERYIQETLRNYLIIRTEWLYGRHGKNFVDTILTSAGQQKELRVVDDQRGAPTFTKDLGLAIGRLIKIEALGVLHVTNSGSCTWFEFAHQILREKGLNQGQVVPISSAELARPARRPAYSVLDCRKFERLTGRKMRPWEEALKEYLS
jgi:dTDP-4-dehydrorhamnose reductase